MFLKPNQMYLESQGLYQKVCRLAQVRVQLKALQVEADNLEQQIYDAMCPATELVDVLYLRTQKGLSEAELSELFVARKEQDGSLTVHPAYVSERFRPGGTLPDIMPGDNQLPIQQMELFPEFVEAENFSDKSEEECQACLSMPLTRKSLRTETEEERERVLPPAPLSPQEKEEEREAAANPEKKKASAQKESVPVVVTDDAAADSSIDVNAFIKFFNGLMPQNGIPQIQCLKGKRLEALQARCREFGKGAVVRMIQNAARSSFLNGRGKQCWRASIDWLLKPNNFPKVLEGIYFDPQRKNEMSPERREANREIEQQRHEELWRSIEQRERNCVTYEEYLRLKESAGADAS